LVHKFNFLPVYIIHLPMVVIIGFYVIKFNLPTAAKYLAIVILSLISSVLLYELAVGGSILSGFSWD